MKRLLVFLVVVALFGIGGALWWNNGLKAANPHDKKDKIFVIEKGATVRQVGNKLKDEGLIRDSVVFFLYVKKEGSDKNLQAGDYKLSPSMNLKTVLSTLKHGILDIWITIPEGFRTEEIVEVLKGAKLKNYNDNWVQKVAQNEGFLFPDTYLIPKDVTHDTVISIMRGNFFEKISELGLTSDSPNLRQIVITASLIEREAKTNEERPIISGIIKNRLDAGMALQIDATLQYIKGYDSTSKKWWSAVSSSDKRINSPYNTYLYSGLPRAPIANPGLSSLKAALNPAQTDYFYYLHDLSGKIYYAQTLSEHNANIQKYLQ